MCCVSGILVVAAVEARDLVKIYPNNVVALDRVSISIRRGVVFSLLGRNGAGKTTFIRIISTQLMPTSGEARVFGYDVVREEKKVRSLVSVMPQESSPHPFLTPFEHIYYYLRLRGFSSNEAREEANRWLRELELWEYRNRPTAHLSGGLRRRVLVAMVLASNADLLIFDEPTTGLDPFSRRIVWNDIKLCRKMGKTVLLATHYMDEAENLSDEIAIIDRGKILVHGSIDNVKSVVRARYVAIVEGEVDINELMSYGEVIKLRDAFYTYINDVDTANELVSRLLKRGVSVRVRPITLEDVFIRVVGGENHEIRK